MIIEGEVTRILIDKKTLEHKLSTGEKVKKTVKRLTPAKKARLARVGAELAEEARVRKELWEEKLKLEKENDEIMGDLVTTGDYTVPMEIDEPTDNETSMDKGTSIPDSVRSKSNRISKPETLETAPEDTVMERPIDKPFDIYSELNLEDPT